jgi:hypothetical protein
MRKAEITVGLRYTDNKGNVREVIAKGEQYVLYDGQADKDNLRYKVIAKKRGKHMVGDECNCTTTAFASWAKSVVKD